LGYEQSEEIDNIVDQAEKKIYNIMQGRSQKGYITWEKYNKILQYNPIATPKIYHSLWQFE